MKSLGKKCIFIQLKNQEFSKTLKQITIKSKKFEGNQKFDIPNVQSISIIGNNVQNLSNLSKNKFQHLTKYIVEDNTQLQTIPLLDAPNMQKISIKNKKQARLINTEQFKKGTYKKLKSLRLQKTIFGSIDLGCCDLLEEIILIYNRIQKPDRTFYKFGDNLIHIILKQNRILQLPSVIKGEKIKTFDISQNSITSIDFLQKSQFPQLIQISFGYNQIIALPSINSPKLKKLIGNNNQISSLNKFAQKQYPSLLQIDLNLNRINILPTLKCPKLINLTLENNSIQSVEKSKFPCLKFLSLNYNLLVQFPSIQMSQLQILCIIRNQIKTIPSIYFPKLKRLNLQFNNISNIQGLSQHEYPQLQYCLLQFNYIEQIPALKFPKIILINVSQNSLKQINGLSHQSYPHLKTLDLSNSKTQSTDNDKYYLPLPAFKMPKLQNLILDSSYILNFNEFSNGKYPELKALNISKNNFVKQLPILNTPKLQTLTISNIQSLKKFLQGKYPCLKQISIINTDMNFLHSCNGSESCFQQLVTRYEAKQNIIILPSIFQKQLRSYFMTNLINIDLDLDLMILKSTQFISFLNLESIKNIRITNHYYSPFIKNLSKLNAFRLKQLTKVSIRNILQPTTNMLHFSVQNSLQGSQQKDIYNVKQKQFYIDSYQRHIKRFYRNIEPIQFEFSYNTKQSTYFYNYKNFTQFHQHLHRNKLCYIRKEMRRK